MMKNNLLQSKPKVYVKKSTEREVYETESCFLLRVSDSANALEEISEQTGEEVDTVVENMYNSMKNYQLNNAVSKSIDSKKYDVVVKISSYQWSRRADVKISKRSVTEKVRSGIRSFLDEWVC